MKDRSNIIKEAIEYRDKLEKKVEELAQSVVRLQISLDFADNTIKKKDRENAELKAENARLIESLGIANKYVNKYHQTLQEIKEIAENEIKEFTDSAVHGGRYLEILQLITKAESEG